MLKLSKDISHSLVYTKTEYDYLYGWLEKKLSHKVVNPKDLVGYAEEEENIDWCMADDISAQ